jgi:hypothetical protein
MLCPTFYKKIQSKLENAEFVVAVKNILCFLDGEIIDFDRTEEPTLVEEEDINIFENEEFSNLAHQIFNYIDTD